MQPPPPQLPRDDSQRPASKNLKQGALWVLLALAVVAAILAFVLPHQQAKDAGNMPSSQHRTESPGYSHPTNE